MKCTDKATFETRREAYEQTQHIRWHKTQRKRKMYVYECPICSKYHITHYSHKFMPPKRKFYFNDLTGSEK